MFVIVVAFLLAIGSVQAEIISRTPFASQIHDMSWQKISYRVHDLTVMGFIITPKELAEGKKYPVIFYNRGGWDADGKNGEHMADIFRYFTTNGYIIFATQYRGIDGGTGKDNFGGNDIHDVLELIKVAQKEPYVDTNNMFMLGWSRGGMQTYIALRGHLPINAAATVGGISDLALWVAEWHNGAENLRTMLASVIPGFNDESMVMFESVSRSAVCFADELTTPLLLMHGTNDSIVRINQTNLLAEGLRQARCPHEVFRYNGGHELPLHHFDKIIAWFKKHTRSQAEDNRQPHTN